MRHCHCLSTSACSCLCRCHLLLSRLLDFKRRFVFAPCLALFGPCPAVGRARDRLFISSRRARCISWSARAGSGLLRCRGRPSTRYARSPCSAAASASDSTTCSLSRCSWTTSTSASSQLHGFCAQRNRSEKSQAHCLPVFFLILFEAASSICCSANNSKISCGRDFGGWQPGCAPLTALIAKHDRLTDVE